LTVSAFAYETFSMDSKWNVPASAAAQNDKGRWTTEEGWKIYMQGAAPKHERPVEGTSGNGEDGEAGGKAEAVDTDPSEAPGTGT
jgi:hypothetical protein